MVHIDICINRNNRWKKYSLLYMWLLRTEFPTRSQQYRNDVGCRPGLELWFVMCCPEEKPINFKIYFYILTKNMGKLKASFCAFSEGWIAHSWLFSPYIQNSSYQLCRFSVMTLGNQLDHAFSYIQECL